MCNFIYYHLQGVYYIYFNYQFTAKTFTEFIPNYHKDINSKQISQNNNLIQKKLDDEKTKGKRLEKEIQSSKKKYNEQTDEVINLKKIIQNLKNENNNLKNENNNLKNENNNLKNENNNLKIKLSSGNQFNQFNQINITEINKLKEIINQKDKEINELKLKIPKPKVYMDDIIVINFLSSDQTIRYGIKCLPNDTFAEVEEKLYQIFNEFRNTNNLLLFKGNQILRFKTIKENNIHDGDTIQLHQPQ